MELTAHQALVIRQDPPARLCQLPLQHPCQGALLVGFKHPVTAHGTLRIRVCSLVMDLSRKWRKDATYELCSNYAETLPGIPSPTQQAHLWRLRLACYMLIKAAKESVKYSLSLLLGPDWRLRHSRWCAGLCGALHSDDGLQ